MALGRPNPRPFQARTNIRGWGACLGAPPLPLDQVPRIIGWRMGKGLFIGVVGQMMRRWSEVRVEEDECGVDRTL
ncbi:hypothetical protein CRG98_036813 [Punica granatum]|uniref:Uncharacterized protein n=1 Tax=Punica granatum TaxID=22663 RepID=A0A2I0IFP3_PUNGR|nr:hypothetical protein CRG98_036813 [Punica granatum]